MAASSGGGGGLSAWAKGSNRIAGGCISTPIRLNINN
jgi:hypothetical protein